MEKAETEGRDRIQEVCASAQGGNGRSLAAEDRGQVPAGSRNAGGEKWKTLRLRDCTKMLQELFE